MKSKKGLLILGSLFLLLLVSLWVLTPPALTNRADLPQIDAAANDDIELWLQRSEQLVSAKVPIISGTEKKVTWHGTRGLRTPFSVVYIHGFSATRREIAPLQQQVAQSLGANLFETRLFGHGLEREAMENMRAEDLLQDAADALAVATQLGDRVIVIGTSTGATVALAMLDFSKGEKISHLVMLSPNFGPADPNSEFLTWPAGAQLARAMVGSYHRWDPANELQARYWTTRYPVDALVEMMRLVKYVRSQLPITLNAGVMVAYSPHDTVVSIDKLLQAWQLIDSPHKEIYEMPDADNPANPGMHVLAGDIMAPQNTRDLSARIVRFVRQSPDTSEAEHSE